MAKGKFEILIDQHRPDLGRYEELYRDLHAHPELSTQEERTAKITAQHLRELPDFDVIEGIGGFGVVGILRNGSGRTILLRADMDGLPVQEKTDLPYASTDTMKDKVDGLTKPTMHACGHDTHVTCLLAATEVLSKARREWKGTLIALFQPNEERAGGAKAMIKDNLYQKVPVPDIVLGQHVMPLKAGTLGTRPGLMASAADSFLITLYGRGGHASQPHRTLDPVVMAAQVIVRLQTIVSREVAPAEAAVVSVGSIQAGMTENIIPDQAVIKVNVRTMNAQTRAKVLASIQRIVKAECEASNAPRAPLIEPTSQFPLTINNEEVTTALEESFAAYFGESYSSDVPMLQGSEDFPVLATAEGRPYCYWVFGGVDPDRWDEAEEKGTIDEIPINHSPYFAPVVQPTLKTGIDGMVVAALTFLT
ncbi:MAG: hypothetical protein M1817_001422 [Caeruleum heppii]|nr:MAG: hypothetical protein M1817_001422 [Caeruleum heppii]